MRKLCLLMIFLAISFPCLGLPLTTTANPLVISPEHLGGVYANCSHVQLPEADVTMHINYIGDSVVDVSVSCIFTIRSNITQSGMLAFAYPSSWSVTQPYIESNNGYFNEVSFEIVFDGVHIETWNFDYDNVSWIPNVDEIWNTDSGNPSYVGFNVSLLANVDHSLYVSTAFRKKTTADIIAISYIFASAQTFQGMVNERITMVVEELVPLQQIGFTPRANLTTRIVGQVTTATWNLCFDEAPWYEVSTHLWVDKNEETLTSTIDILDLVIIAVSISSVIGITVLFLRKFRN